MVECRASVGGMEPHAASIAYPRLRATTAFCPRGFHGQVRSLFSSPVIRLVLLVCLDLLNVLSMPALAWLSLSWRCEYLWLHQDAVTTAGFKVESPN